MSALWHESAQSAALHLWLSSSLPQCSWRQQDCDNSAGGGTFWRALCRTGADEHAEWWSGHQVLQPGASPVSDQRQRRAVAWAAAEAAQRPRQQWRLREGSPSWSRCPGELGRLMLTDESRFCVCAAFVSCAAHLCVLCWRECKN